MPHMGKLGSIPRAELTLTDMETSTKIAEFVKIGVAQGFTGDALNAYVAAMVASAEKAAMAANKVVENKRKQEEEEKRKLLEQVKSYIVEEIKELIEDDRKCDPQGWGAVAKECEDKGLEYRVECIRNEGGVWETKVTVWSHEDGLARRKRAAQAKAEAGK